MKEDLAALQSSIDDFLHAAVHDIRGPLGQVRSLAVLLERQHKAALNEEGRELCGLIELASRRAIDVLEAIHTYVRISEPPVFRTCDLNSIVDAACFALQTLIEQNEAVISRDALPCVHGDPAKLLILFEELFRNSLKFRADTQPRIHCTSQACEGDQGHLILFSVIDNGIGIAQKESEAIFKPLKRLHGRDREGTGMGLAICRRIVEMHAGQIWTGTRSQRGAAFCFTLPASKPIGVEERQTIGTF